MSVLTPQKFVERWQNTPLGERQSYQIHFNEVCQLVGYEPPSGSGIDAQGRAFGFEYGIKKDTGGQGFADVFYEGRFAIEYKAPGKYRDLKEAYQQLLQYREKLKNPPLLVVTDIENWEIHTNWPNTDKRVYRFSNAEIANRPSVFTWLQWLFEAPERLHPRRNTEQVTADAADVFRMIADEMRREDAAPERIAHFLTKLVFCLFAEDVSLLPPGPRGDNGIFAEIVENTHREPTRFKRYMEELFRAMADGGEVMFQKIPYFDGALFKDVQVEDIPLEALGKLAKAANLNWSSVEPAIFGTLFERSLDPSKRAQLGAHYTRREDILLIVEPVLMQPLRREWAAIQEEAAPIRAKYDEALAGSNRRLITQYEGQLKALREQMLKQLREIRVLDPACGSGNFLYVSLQLLMDMEKEVIHHDLWRGLTLVLPEVHPHQMYGIEINPIAHDLASIVVWIGYLQWQQNNGYLRHKEPILEDLHQNIRLMDAIMNQDCTEPEWPEVDVIVGNPPFLGDKRMRGELGDKYVESLRNLYDERVPGGADLVCYWYEKARVQLDLGKTKRAGLLATNSIRGGANRKVLERIKETGDIFMAWSDREWVLDGAAVRVSMVGFDDSTEQSKMLDGIVADTINADLTGRADITKAHNLEANHHIAFLGNTKNGAFDISNDVAQKMMTAQNQSKKSNHDVLKRWINGYDIADRDRGMWIIDFGLGMAIEEAKLYEAPFEYIQEHVYPDRIKSTTQSVREVWWLHERPRPDFRARVSKLSRYLATIRHSKHRLFVWVDKTFVPDSALVAIARDDDYFFGVLHSRIHEVWALRMGTSLEDRPRYTPTTTFETFPFPWPPGQEDTISPTYQAIAVAAKQLHEERAAWLNPPGASESALTDRTLTNLYNALNVWRGKEAIKTKAAAGDFAPRLDELHTDLDRAVCAAYGWPESVLADEEEILRLLLVLNLERATGGDETTD